MLFVWVFALVASWVNACILQPSGATADRREHHQRITVTAHHGSIPEGAGGASGTDEPGPAQEACASFCDTEQRIVAKAQPSPGDGAADPFALAAPVFAHRPALAPGRADRRWRPLAAPPPSGPPVVIAFLRLTL